MDQQKPAIYEFGEFRLDALRLSLTTADGRTVPLKPKACEILLALIESRSQVATKDELMRRVWGGAFVEEGNLTVNLSSVRKALGDSTDRPRFIITLPGKGYRFVADVREVSERVPESESESHEAESAPPSAKSRPAWWRWVWIGAAVVMLGLGAVVAWAIYRTRHPAAPLPFANFRLTKLTTSGNARSAAISPDGRFVAYVIEENQAQSIWLKQLNAAGDRSILGPLNETHLAGLVFSKSGDEIYFLKSDQANPGALVRTGLLGGKLEKLADDVDSPPALSPDGRTVAFIRGMPTNNSTALFVLPAAGGEARPLASRAAAKGFVISANPAWTEDGKNLICAVEDADDRGSYFGLVRIDAATGQAAVLPSPRFTRIDQIALLSSNRGLLVAGATEATSALNQIWHLANPEGTARRITNDLYDYRELSVTADGGTLIAVKKDVQTNIWLAPGLSDERATQLTNTNYDGAEGLAYAANGDLIYTSRGTDALDLWSLSPDGAKRQLTFGKGNNTLPAVSPDGRSVAFVSTRSGAQHLWIMSIDGSNARQLTNGDDDGAPDWTPEGTAIIYRTYVKGVPFVFTVPAGGGTPAQLTDKLSGPPRVSPDGKKILVQIRAADLAVPKLSLVDIKGGPTEADFDTTSARYQWLPDGRSFIYVNASQDNAMNLRRQAVDPHQPPEQLTHWPAERIYAFALTRDGKTAAVARGRNLSDVVLFAQTVK
jgi:Tol biopolymer transport system component/DNA-binding winged helix-turn-helix (wHTH) protein